VEVGLRERPAGEQRLQQGVVPPRQRRHGSSASQCSRLGPQGRRRSLSLGSRDGGGRWEIDLGACGGVGGRGKPSRRAGKETSAAAGWATTERRDGPSSVKQKYGPT
jgi:hypothetical protein